MARVHFTDFPPLFPVDRRTAVEGLVLVAKIGNIPQIGTHARGHEIKTEEKFESSGNHGVEPSVRVGKIKDKLPVFPPADQILEHGVQTDIFGDLVCRNSVEDLFSPAVFDRIRRVKVNVIPEIPYSPASVFRVDGDLHGYRLLVGNQDCCDFLKCSSSL